MRFHPRQNEFATLVAVLAILIAQHVLASPAARGRWTSKYDADALWGEYPAVHMILTRGAIVSGSSYHSQILWYDSHHPHDEYGGTFFGGLWGWKPDSTTGGSNCTDYPGSRFTELDSEDPPANVFCTGHSALADGRVLVSGGTEHGEVGITQSAIFDPASRTWDEQDEMTQQRWYPTSTTLPNGRVLISSGSKYGWMNGFGGRTGSDTGTLAPDSLNRFALTSAGQWDAPARTISGDWPQVRDAHSAALNSDAGSWAIFGGREQDGDPLQDTWLIYHNPDKDTREDYSAAIVAGGSANKPSPRFRHAAVCPDTVSRTGAMYVYGGRGLAALYGDLHRLHAYVVGDTAIVWEWEEPFMTGAPAARQGHTAVWDPENKKILVFGGADLSDQPLGDTLYALSLGSTYTWSRPTVDAASGSPGRPSARHGHLLVFDPILRSVHTHGAPSSNYNQRFILVGGEDADSLRNDVWVLWIPKAGSGVNYKWQRIDLTGTMPSGRYRMAGDIENGNERLIIQGGDVNASSSTASDETWALPLWELSTGSPEGWVQLPDHPQRAMIGHTMNTISGELAWARKQEVLEVDDDWEVIAEKSQDWYPFHFVMPSSDDSIRVFAAGPDTASYVLNVSASPARWMKIPAVGTPDFRGGSAVMYRPGKVMKCGSRDTDTQFSYATTSAMKIDLTASPPVWSNTDAIGIGRVNHNMVILPDGKVFVSGGTNYIKNLLNQDPVFTPQIWNPDTGGWTPMSGTTALLGDSTIRGYHSNAILLPDGRVLTHGGFSDYGIQAQAGLDMRRATMYCPPYLFNADSTLKTRPRASAPMSVLYGSEFSVCDLDGAGIAAVNLIRSSSSTHGFNQDQRFVPLSFQTCPNSGVVTVTSPLNEHVAPPGDYLLFLISTSSSKSPSVGRWIRLGEEDPYWIGCPCEFGGGAFFAGGSGEGEDFGSPENAFLLGESERPYRLKSDATEDGDYVVRVRQSQGGTTSVDQIALDQVLHGANERAFAAGAHYVTGTVEPAQEVTGPDGDVTELATEGMDEFVVVSAGDTLTVSLGTGSQESETPRTLHLEAKRASNDLYGAEVVPQLTVLGLDPIEGWQVIATVEPRRDFDEIVIEGCSDQVRLAFNAGMHVRQLGEVVVTDADADATTVEGLNAVHSSDGSASEMLETTDSSMSELNPADELTMRWPVPSSQEQEGVASLFLRATVSSTTLARLPQSNEMASSRPSNHVFELKSAAPNPFKGTALVGFSLATAGHARLRLYNLAGRHVRTLENQPLAAGPNVAMWDGRDQSGAFVSSGVYFARLESQGQSATRNIVFVGRD